MKPSKRLLLRAGRSHRGGQPDYQDQAWTSRPAAQGNDTPSPHARPTRREGVRGPVAPTGKAVAGSGPDS